MTAPYPGFARFPPEGGKRIFPLIKNRYTYYTIPGAAHIISATFVLSQHSLMCYINLL